MNYLIASVSNISSSRKNVSDIVPVCTEYTITKIVWVVLPPILLLVGTVGNCITIAVYVKSQMRTTTMAVYLSTLAVSDIVALYSGLFMEWLQVTFDIKRSRYGSVGCKLHSWLLFTSVQLSAWIIVAITLERVICVWFPFRARRTETTTYAQAVVLFLCCAMLSLNSHALYGMTIGHEHELLYPICAALNIDYLHFFRTLWPYIDSTVYCFIPCFLILCGNAMILIKMERQRKFNFRTGHGRHVSDMNEQTLRDRRAQSLLPLVFRLNTVFLVTTAPISVFQIAFNFTHISIDKNQSLVHYQLFLLWTILMMVMFTNHAINCLLYCLSGTKFRREAIALFCKKS